MVATDAASVNRSMSRRMSVPLVRMENGFRRAMRALRMPRHQSVPTLDSLVRVRPRAHRDVLALPPTRRELPRQDLRCVDLHHDLRFEVASGIHIQIGMGRPREAIDAGVRAPAIRVDRPIERHPAGHLVDH